MTFEECDQITQSPENLFASVQQDPNRWQLFIYNAALDASQYQRVLQENADIQAQNQALESNDEQLANARNQLQQSLRAQQLLKDQVNCLTD